MRKKESILKAQILGWLNSLPDAHFVKLSDRFSSGLPDIIGSFQRRGVFLEVKVPGEKTTPLQEYHLAKFSLAGGCCGVVTCIEDVETIFKRDGLI